MNDDALLRTRIIVTCIVGLTAICLMIWMTQEVARTALQAVETYPPGQCIRIDPSGNLVAAECRP